MFSPVIYAALSALVPVVIGLYAWRQLGKPGAAVLALLMWALALGTVARVLELWASTGAQKILFHTMEGATALAVAPLWLVFTLQYTGRERWLTRTRVALITAVPLATLVLIIADGGGGSLWTFAGSSFPSVEYDPWFWVDLTYRALLVFIASALLFLMVVNSQRLYGRQSLCLLAGFLPPWVVVTAHQLGFAPISGPHPLALAFALTGLSFTLALLRYQLLDISPVAHDAVVEGMSDGTIVLDLRNRIVDLNPAAGYILGSAAAEVVGRDFREVMSSRAGAAPLEGNRGNALLRRYEEHGHAHEEIRLGKGESARHYDMALSALHDARGRRTGHLVVLHEITERKLAVERLDKMAHYDVLTGLPNRAFFYERLSQEIARSRRSRRLLAVFFLDIDRFKVVNDTLGHGVGDLLLKEVAVRISSAVREYDVVSRLAGDEFTVILPDITEAADATVVAERIVESFADPFVLVGNELRATTSVGVCFYPTDGADPTTLVKSADTAMYKAKAAGKNRYELFTEGALAGPTEHLELETELVRALEHGELVLYYQPELRISTSRMVGVEALLRWEHPERGLLHPQDFLPVAEETGLIFAVERWILREACGQMRSWQERYPTEWPLTVGVNLSSRHFMHPNLVGEVYRILQETDLPPESLVLEVKEGVLHEDALSARATLQALKQLGVGLAVDNFGTGYSSLAHLKRFPLDALKIDRSFIQNLKSEGDREIVAAMISLAHALGLQVIAEGVETAQQLMQLRAMNCDAAQGYYFAESLSHRATSAFLVADLYY